MAVQGQEALYGFLLSWQEGLNTLANTRMDPAIASDQLQKIKAKCSKHLEELEAAAAIVDSSTDSSVNGNVAQVYFLYFIFFHLLSDEIN